MWIKLTEKETGTTAIINLKIIPILLDSSVKFKDNQAISFRESPDEIIELIREQEALARGNQCTKN